MISKNIKTTYEAGEIVKTEIGNLRINKYLGRGKSAYSYLAGSGRKDVVLKIMHNEPVPYYSFEKNKVLHETNAYELLKSLDISIPEMYCSNPEEQYLVKEYIPGMTGAEWIAESKENYNVIKQLFGISAAVESCKYNIDYFPANFVICLDKLYYIDYEANIYDERWNLKNWGIYYWANKEGFKRFLKEGDASAINIDVTKGLPIKEPFEEQIREWICKFA